MLSSAASPFFSVKASRKKKPCAAPISTLHSPPPALARKNLFTLAKNSRLNGPHDQSHNACRSSETFPTFVIPSARLWAREESAVPWGVAAHSLHSLVERFRFCPSLQNQSHR